MDGPLLAPRAVWRRLLSVDKCPSLMTYAAVPQMHRTEAGGAMLGAAWEFKTRPTRSCSQASTPELGRRRVAFGI